MNNCANKRVARNDLCGYFRSAICWTAVSGIVLVVLLVLLAVSAGNHRGSPVPQIVGAWALTFTDGTTQVVTLNADGTLSANDNVVYRWTGISAAAH